MDRPRGSAPAVKDPPRPESTFRWRSVGMAITPWARRVGVWAAHSAEELHKILRELPIYPYVTVNVVELEPHSLTIGR
ncbi:muconolactone Delta-isomerase family protein [Nocardia terpenica]|uniref:Muconolactone isomerase domain-containing protein n=1 Tax=Nocardia terpenica TaxID=455432 RepID=A0A6G9YVM2_9NOCA|nr:hypothetical protein F6W96_02755 [Nocardia terpenica]